MAVAAFERKKILSHYSYIMITSQRLLYYFKLVFFLLCLLKILFKFVVI